MDGADEGGERRTAGRLAGAGAASLVTLFMTVSFASLVWTGPVAAHRSLGVSLFLVGTVLMNIVATRRSGIGGVCVTPQDSTTAVLAAGLLPVLAVAASDARLPTALAVLVVTGVVTGGTQLLVARGGLGRLTRSVPQPVVGGFVAGTGWLLVTGAVELGRDASGTAVVVNVGGGAVLAVALLVAARSRHAAVGVPALLLGAVAAVHLGVAVTGTGLGRARESGLLPATAGWPEPPTGALGAVNVGAVLTVLPTVGAVALVAVLANLLNVGAITIGGADDPDLDHELRTTGLGNLAAAAVATAPGYPALGASLIARRLGARGAEAAVLTAAVCAVAAVAGPWTHGLLPTVVVVGVLGLIGLDFLVEWLVLARRRMPRREHALMLAIVVAVVALGFLAGVVVGLLAAVALFALEYSSVDPVRASYTAADRPSALERPSTHRAHLHRVGGAVRVVELGGHLFFGTATTAADRLTAVVEQERPLVLVLDLHDLSGADSTAALALQRVARACATARTRLVVAGGTPTVLAALAAGLGGADVVADLDEAVELVESELLSDVASVGSTALASSPELAAAVARLPLLHAAAGEVLADDAATGDAAAWVVASGRLTAEVRGVDGRWQRVRVVGPGSIVGELALYAGTPRSGRLRADEDSVLHRVDAATLERLERTEPATAAALHRAVASVVAERLVAADRLLAARSGRGRDDR